MKLKTLKKKIRKLEARLQEGPAKLAKLKRKLEAMTKAKADSLTAKPPVNPAGVKRRRAVKKVKRKLNLSPERRAQLAAAMKARWAAKREAAQPTPKKTSTDRDFTLREVPQAR